MESQKPIFSGAMCELLGWGTCNGGIRVLGALTSFCPQEALPGLIWGLEQQLGDLSLESGGLEQESGRSSGEQRRGAWLDTPLPAPPLCSYSCSPGPSGPPESLSPLLPGTQASMKIPAPLPAPILHPPPSVGTVASPAPAPTGAWVPVNPEASMPARGPSL